MMRKEIGKLYIKMDVYAFIGKDEWKLYVPESSVLIEGDQEDSDDLRNQVKSLMEMLCFLRKYSEKSYQIYINSSYCINCNEKWIPKWLENGFRIGNTAQLRPNTDLLVQLYSFRRCMDFELVQHYDDYDTYKSYFREVV